MELQTHWQVRGGGGNIPGFWEQSTRYFIITTLDSQESRIYIYVINTGSIKKKTTS